MNNEFFSYEKWVEEALRDVIKRALQQTVIDGLPGDHHFFITFLTGPNDVNIPDHLRAEHPEEMTIVLQHQFHNLSVTDEGFSVNLSFNGRQCHLSIPFKAITAFADPAVNFVLQLKMAHQNQLGDGADATNDAPGPVAVDTLAVVEDINPQPSLAEDDDDSSLLAPGIDADLDDDKMGEVIALDTFRKK